MLLQQVLVLVLGRSVERHLHQFRFRFQDKFIRLTISSPHLLQRSHHGHQVFHPLLLFLLLEHLQLNQTLKVELPRVVGVVGVPFGRRIVHPEQPTVLLISTTEAIAPGKVLAVLSIAVLRTLDFEIKIN